MKRRFIPYSDETHTGSFRQGFRIVIREPYRFLLDEFMAHPSPYAFLTEKKGTPVKEERRTVIRVWKAGERDLYFKHYFYRGISQMKTLLSRMPKAQREYLTMGLLKHLGVPGVEAAGWGVRWNRLGSVQSCFILTVREEDTRDFRAWLKKTETDPGFRERAAVILRKLGGLFRRMHEERFFLLRPNTRNVLIRYPETGDPEVLFLDQPYARFLTGPAARWGQLRDLATLLGGVLRHFDERIIDEFYETYLPDPVGTSPEILHQRLKLALRARESEGRGGKIALQCRALLPHF